MEEKSIWFVYVLVTSLGIWPKLRFTENMRFKRDLRDKLIQWVLNCAPWKPRIPQKCCRGSTNIWLNLFVAIWKTDLENHATQMCSRSKFEVIEITDCDLVNCLMKKCYTFQFINKLGMPLLSGLCTGEPCETLFYWGGPLHKSKVWKTLIRPSSSM